MNLKHSKNQLLALLWKSWIIRKVHYISTFFEVICPLLLIFFINYSFSSSNNGDNGGKKNLTLGPEYYDRARYEITYDFKLDFHLYGEDVQLLYTPINNYTNQLMKVFINYTDNHFQAVPCKDEVEMNQKMSEIKFTYGSIYTAGIHFQNTEYNDIKAGKIAYKIRMLTGTEGVAMTKELFPIKFSQAPIDYGFHSSIYRSFSYYQAYIHREYIKLVCEYNQIDNCDQYIKPIKVYKIAYPKYANPQSTMFSTFDLIGLFMIYSYVIFCPLLVKRITDEKSTKSRELLRLIGMSDMMYWFSHFINNFIVLFVHSIIATILLKTFIISYASAIVVFLGVLLFTIQLILFSMMITTVFNRPIIAVIVTATAWLVIPSIFIALLVPGFNIDKVKDLTLANPYRRLACMTPSGTIIFFFSLIGQYENYGISVNFDNLSQHSVQYGSFTVLEVLLLSLLSIPVYCFLIWYLDNVWPFQDGVPKPVYYLFQKSYWFPDTTAEVPSSYRDWDQNEDNEDPKLFESVSGNDNAVISLKDVTKEFSSGVGNKKIAVDGLNWKIYPNQITVLLGHNGAGKSTTMNMITGMFKPSSGSVYINGFNIATQTKMARRSLSLCPQENIIFVELTVYQHLYLFSMLKGSSTEIIDREVDDVLNLLKLTDKKNEMAINLSGGMKRKLSLGIALIGSTNTLILDEPTSGMDPDARRVIWDLLLSIRRERTILITTHYMEEADVLADRIAIMNAGKLNCSGSPYFLKNALGTGYRLRIAKLPNFDSTQFLNVLHRYIPTAHLLSEVETEVIISLETDIQKNDLMVKLMHIFQDMEKNKNVYKIDSFGLSYSTLEDVFLKVGSDLEWNGLNADSIENERLELSRANELNSGFDLIMNQFMGLLLKRFHHSRRNWVMFILQLWIPAIIIFTAVMLQNFFLGSFTASTSASLNMSTINLYGSNTRTFYYGNDLLRKTYKNIIQEREKGVVFFEGENVSKRTVDNAVLADVNNDLSKYIHHYLYGLGVADNNYSIFMNEEQYHSIPLIHTVLFDTILQQILGSSSKLSTNVVSEPFLVKSQQEQQNLLAIILPWACTTLIFLPIAFPFLSSSYIMFAIEENVSKSKLIQLMTKMSPVVYWTSNYIFDMISHLIAIGILFLIIFIFDTHHVIYSDVSNNAGGALFLLMFTFGLSTIPIAYVLSYRFAKPSSGFVFLVIVSFLLGFIFNLFMSIVQFTHQVTSSTFMKSSFEPILSIIRAVPIFSFLFGYQKVFKVSSFIRLCEDMPNLENMCKGDVPKILQGCCPQCDPCYKTMNPFSMGEHGAGTEVVYMISFGILSFSAITLFELFKVSILSRLNEFLQRKNNNSFDMALNQTSQKEDHDVEIERARIEEAISNNHDRNIFSVLHLRKQFGNFTAVDDLTFGVNHGECFGLLGVNGAGKTTTFSMLTGDLIPSSGNAFICDGKYSLVDDLNDFQAQIGYCPQFDALLNLLTGEETLFLFARLRGIPRYNQERDIKNLIKMVGLEKHAKKVVGAYSGGNKRKLSIAVALVGNPKILFLDEPSSGVDPAARRKIWQTLGYLKRNFDCSIILTSHSMEECEALCSRLGIMVNGRFRCLGSTQHLRSLYGQGYLVIISIKKQFHDNQEYINRVNQKVIEVIPSALLKDIHQGLIQYHITDPNEKWSTIFERMVYLNQILDFEDYHVSDTTLEQIFLTFARDQKVALRPIK